MLEPALPRPRYWPSAPDSANAVALSRKLVAYFPRQGGERREKEEDLEAADLEDLDSETAAEEATTVESSQTQADCFPMRCHTAAPSQPLLICTEVSLRAERVFASECWLAFSCPCMRNCQFCIVTNQKTLHNPEKRISA